MADNVFVGETIQGLIGSLKDAIETLSKADSSVAVSSGGELLVRFITLTSELEHSVSDHKYCTLIWLSDFEVIAPFDVRSFQISLHYASM